MLKSRWSVLYLPKTQAANALQNFMKQVQTAKDPNMSSRSLTSTFKTVLISWFYSDCWQPSLFSARSLQLRRHHLKPSNASKTDAIHLHRSPASL